MSLIDDAAVFHDIVSLKTDLTNLRYDLIARKDELKFVMETKDPNLVPLKKVWMDTMQLAMKAAGLFESSRNLEASMSTLGNLVNGLKIAMEKTRVLTKGAGKVLERSYIVVFELGGKDYCFHVDTVREVVAPKKFVRLPEMPFFMEGVMEHRKTVVPIIDPADILQQPHSQGKGRLLLVRKNGDSVALMVDKVKQIVPVLSGYFREPREDEPLLKMVYEDGTRKIDMLDPKLMLESGLQNALRYSHRLNSLSSGQLMGGFIASSSRLSHPASPNYGVSAATVRAQLGHSAASLTTQSERVS
jgi:chemotaxis signal transduction protein